MLWPGRCSTKRGDRPNPAAVLDKAIPVWSFAAVYTEPDDSFVIVH